MNIFKRLFKNKKVAIPVVVALVVILTGAGIVYSQKGTFNIFASGSESGTPYAVTATVQKPDGTVAEGVQVSDNEAGPWPGVTNSLGMIQVNFTREFAKDDIRIEVSSEFGHGEYGGPINRSNKSFTIKLSSYGTPPTGGGDGTGGGAVTDQATVSGKVYLDGVVVDGASIKITRPRSDGIASGGSNLSGQGGIGGYYSKQITPKTDYPLWAEIAKNGKTYYSDRNLTVRAESSGQNVPQDLYLNFSDTPVPVAKTDIKVYGQATDQTGRIVEGATVELYEGIVGADNLAKKIATAKSTVQKNDAILGSFNFIVPLDQVAMNYKEAYSIKIKKDGCSENVSYKEVREDGYLIPKTIKSDVPNGKYNRWRDDNLELTCTSEVAPSEYNVEGVIGGISNDDLKATSSTAYVTLYRASLTSGYQPVANMPAIVANSATGPVAYYRFYNVKLDWQNYKIEVTKAGYKTGAATFTREGKMSPINIPVQMTKDPVDPPSSPDQTYAVFGRVTDANDSNIPSEIRVWKRLNSGGHESEFKTFRSVNGNVKDINSLPKANFQITGLKQGTYDIEVVAPGYTYDASNPGGKAGLVIGATTCGSNFVYNKDAVIVKMLEQTLKTASVGRMKQASSAASLSLSQQNILGKVGNALAGSVGIIDSTLLADSSDQSKAYAASQSSLPSYGKPNFIFYPGAPHGVTAGLGLIYGSVGTKYAGLQIITDPAILDGNPAAYYSGVVKALMDYYPNQIKQSWKMPTDPELRLNLEAATQVYKDQNCVGVIGIWNGSGSSSDFWNSLTAGYTLDHSMFSWKITQGGSRGNGPVCRGAAVVAYKILKEQSAIAGFKPFKPGTATINSQSSALEKALAPLGFKIDTPKDWPTFKVSLASKAYTVAEIESWAFLQK